MQRSEDGTMNSWQNKELKIHRTKLPLIGRSLYCLKSLNLGINNKNRAGCEKQIYSGKNR